MLIANPPSAVPQAKPRFGACCSPMAGELRMGLLLAASATDLRNHGNAATATAVRVHLVGSWTP